MRETENLKLIYLYYKLHWECPSTKFFNQQLLFLFSRVSELLDYTAEELTGQSMYALCHGEDVHKLKNTHEDCKFKKQTL